MWADETQFAEPLERFAALHTATVRTSRSGVIDLSYPNPRVDRETRAFNLLRRVLSDVTQADLQYTPFGGGTVVRRRIAGALSRRLELRFGYRDVLLTPGATGALVVAFTTLFRPGDEVVVVTPCWMDYPLYLRRLGVETVFVPSGGDKRLDLDRLAAACGPRTAGVIVGQPACPTGVVHTAAELTSLAAVLDDAYAQHGRRIALISDEVHRDQAWGDIPFVSPMTLYPHAVSVYSFGKAWALQGQRTGYLALGPDMERHDEIVVQAERALRSTGLCAPTALMQRMVLELVDLDPDLGSLRGDQVRMRELLAELGDGPVRGDGSSFVYVRCPEGVDDWEFVTRLAGQRLLAMPSSLFHEPGYFRFALNVGSDRYEEVVGRAKAAWS